MVKGRQNTKLTSIIIWSGVILGVLDWLTDAMYAAHADFSSAGFHVACVLFLLLQPISYMVLFIKFVKSQEDIIEPEEKREKMCFSFQYAFLQQCKLMGSFDTFNNSIQEKFEGDEKIKKEFVNLENSYRVQIINELVLQTLPQMLIQISNNLSAGWSVIAIISFSISVLVFIKDLLQLTIFAVKKWALKQEVNLRPQNYITLQKLDEKSIQSMQAYLTDSQNTQLGMDGNTALHGLARQSEDIEKLDEAVEKNPHQLFMLNKHGQTPLDICIEFDSLNNLDITQEDSAISPRNEGQDLEKGKINHVKRKNVSSTFINRSKTTKVIDESQTLGLVGEMDIEQMAAAAKAQQCDRMNKTLLLMEKMAIYHPNCSIKFLKQPNRLDLKFERSFAMALKKSRDEIIAHFPKRTIKTVYVSMSQLKDLRQFKADKRSFDQEIITTPLHLACQTSNVEAARILLTDHNFDVNILLYERNFLVELLTTGGYQDFAILSNIFKKRTPSVNSGSKMPLNQAILRGNQYIIQMMLEHGNPNPFARDENGITPIHVACAKLDWETVMELVKIGGDPELPDKNGNTFLHILCEGEIKDSEYDFAKMAIQQFQIKLTRNNDGKSPLNLLRSMEGTVTHARGQPNYKRRLQDYLENTLANDITFEDHESNSELHLAIIRDDMQKFQNIISDELLAKQQLNLRNSDGKSPLFLIIEHSRQEMFDELFSKYSSQIDFLSKDTMHGNTALHIACLQEHIGIIQKIFDHDSKLCMIPNFLGRSPFFLGCQKRNLELLKIFEDYKTQAIVVQDYLGENMLFMCARESEVEIFNWFQGSNNFFRARGQQNYKGRSIEHIVCMEGKTNIVQDIRPKLDTKDYYGNLPIHYTIQNDDLQMILNYFNKGKVYFELRNFKYETIFHVAAKNNSLQSLQALLQKTVFIEELLKRDFKGDTPLHSAAKVGAIDILEFFLTACTPSFLELENDFGLTPSQALSEKIAILEDKSLDKECSLEEKDRCLIKIEKLLESQKFLDTFEAFVTEEIWAQRFDINMESYLELAEDPNLRTFLDQHSSGQNSNRESTYLAQQRNKN